MKGIRKGLVLAALGVAGCGSSGHATSSGHAASSGHATSSRPAGGSPATCKPYFSAVTALRDDENSYKQGGKPVSTLQVVKDVRRVQKGLDQIDNYATPAEHETLGLLTGSYVLGARYLVEAAQGHKAAAERYRQDSRKLQRTLNATQVGRTLNRICHLNLPPG